MSEEYTPITVDAVKTYYGDSPPAFDDVRLREVVTAINEVKGGEKVAKTFAAYDQSRVAALTPPEFTAVDDKTFRSFYDEGTTFDDGTVKQFLDFASGQKLGADSVKAFIKFDNARLAAAEKAGQDLWTKQETDWKGELEKDPLLTEGGVLQDNLAKTTKVIKTYGGEAKDSGDNEFQEMLKTTGLGNHPAMARFLMRVAKVVPGEGRPAGGAPAGGGSNPASILFDKT